MADFDTLDGITDNIETVLKGLGAVFAVETFTDVAAIPASLLPLGQVFFEGVDFENTHNERPSYAEARFLVSVTMADRNPRGLAREEQKWVHLIRDGLTINALNIGALASSKLVSKVVSSPVRVDHPAPDYGVVEHEIRVRYREL